MAIVTRRNECTNPRARATSTGAAVEVRRNLAPNPLPVGTSGYTYSGLVQSITDDGWARLVTNTTATTFLTSVPYTGLPFGDRASMEVSLDVRAPEASVMVQLVVWQYDGATEIVAARFSGTNTVLAAGESRRLAYQIPRYQVGASVRVLLYVRSLASTYIAGNVVDWRNLLVGDSGLGYFDGSSASPLKGATCSWTGAANASPSILSAIPATINGFASYGPGTGEAGATVALVNQDDGPGSNITSYGRRIITVRKTGASTGWISDSGALNRPVVDGKAGDVVRVSMWLRQIGSTVYDPRLRVVLRNSVGTSVQTSDQPTYTSLPNGPWTYFEHTFVATTDYAQIGWWNYLLSGAAPSAGSTLDCAGVMISINDTGEYFDGSSVVFGSETSWTGTPDASASRMRTFVPDVIRTQADVPPLRLEVFDKNFVPKGPIGDPGYITVIPRHNEPGQISFSVPSNHKRLDELVAPGSHVRVIDENDGHLLSGWVNGWTQRGPERTSVVDFNVTDHLAVLRYVLGWVVPTGAITAQGTAGTNWTMDGPAESVLKAAVLQNAVNRLGLPITVPATQGRGAAVKGRLRMQPLYDRLFPTLDGAGIADSGVGFDMRLVPRQGLVLDTYVPRTIPQVLNEESGVVTEWSYNYTAPVATRAVAGGQGEGQLRLFREKAFPALEAEIGWKRELWRDARDTNDPTTMYERIDETLAEGGAKAGFSVTLAQTKNFRYGAVKKGDMISLGIGGRVLTDRLTEATLSWTKDRGFESRPRVGDRTDSADKKIIKVLQSITRSIQNRNSST